MIYFYYLLILGGVAAFAVYAAKEWGAARERAAELKRKNNDVTKQAQELADTPQSADDFHERMRKRILSKD